MARPPKIKINSIPFSIDFFDRDQMVCIAGEFGIKGEIATIKLLFAVFEEGYFLEWSIYRKAKMIRLLPGVSPELLDQILSRLIKLDFFDYDLFDSANILTSVAIQKIYFNSIKRRTKIKRQSLPFLLIDPEHPNVISAYKTSDSVNNKSNSAINNEVFAYKNNNKRVIIEPQNTDNEGQKEISAYKNGISGTNGQDSVYFRSKIVDQNDSDYKNGFSEYKNPEIVNNNLDLEYNNPKKVSNKTYNKKNNYNISTSNKGVVGGNSHKNSEFADRKNETDMKNFESAVEVLKTDPEIKKDICKLQEITAAEYDILLTKFLIFCRIEGKVQHSDLRDLKMHFSRWIPYGKDIHISKFQANENNIRDRKIQRRGTEANCSRTQNFNTSFSTAIDLVSGI